MDVTVTTRPQQSEPMQMPGCLTFEENLDQLFLRWCKPAPEAPSLHRVRFRKQLRALPKICKSRHQRIKGGKDVAYNFFTYFTKFVFINTGLCLFIFWPTIISALTSHFPSLCFSSSGACASWCWEWTPRSDVGYGSENCWRWETFCLFLLDLDDSESCCI